MQHATRAPDPGGNGSEMGVGHVSASSVLLENAWRWDRDPVEAPAPNPSFAVTIPWTGAWTLRVGEDEALVDSTTVAITPAGHVGRYRHLTGTGRSMIVAVPGAAAHDVLRGRGSAIGDRALIRPTDPAITGSVVDLARALAWAEPDLALDEASLALVRAVLRGIRRVGRTFPSGAALVPGPSSRGGAARTATRRRHREIAHAAAAMLSEELADPPSLDAIARATCTTPFHLCRIFRASTGLTMGRYLRRTRVRASVRWLLDTRASTTEIALELGFASRSHFSDAFRGETGVGPSTLRRRRSGRAASRRGRPDGCRSRAR